LTQNIDIILPNYNSSNTISATINSILKQSYKGWNLIIVDDASNNETIKILKKSGYYNSTQATVVRKGKILALEKKNGTQEMLKKIKKTNNINSGVLVKFPKTKQDSRIDLPTVGLNTFKQCKLAGIKGIVLKNKKNIFLDKKKCITFANKNKMFISVK